MIIDGRPFSPGTTAHVQRHLTVCNSCDLNNPVEIRQHGDLVYARAL